MRKIGSEDRGQAEGKEGIQRQMVPVSIEPVGTEPGVQGSPWSLLGL